MNLSDAIQITHNSQNGLQVYFPPRYPAGILFLVLGVAATVIAVKAHERRLLLYLFGTLAVAFLFIALDNCTYHATVRLSITPKTFYYEERTFYYKTAKTYPLSSLEEAVVKNGTSQNRQLALLVVNGPQIPLGDGYNSRANQYEAAQAINSFIGVNAAP